MLPLAAAAKILCVFQLPPLLPPAAFKWVLCKCKSGEIIAAGMQQQHPRTSHNDGRRFPDNAGIPQPPPPQQQQLHKHHQQQERQKVDGTAQAPSWKAWHVLFWLVKGWWCSALWWVCFACCMLLWCLAYAKADDGGEFATSLDFVIYFSRVRFCTSAPSNFIIVTLTPVISMVCRSLLASQPCAS